MDSQPQTSNPLVLCCLTAMTATPEELIDAAADAGFAGLTLRTARARPEDPIPDVARDDVLVERTRAALEERAMRLVDIEVIRLDADTHVPDLLPIVELGARLGAENVVATSNDIDESRSAETFAALCELAAPLGVRPALEFMIFTATATIDHAFRVVTRAAHPAGTVLVDALHLHRSGGTPADVARLAAEAPERFTHAQICDVPWAPRAPGEEELRRESRSDRVLPGGGELPLEQLCAALPPGALMCVEAPVRAFDGLPAAEIARRAARAARPYVMRAAG